MLLRDNNKITTANTYVILLLIHKALSVLHTLSHLILSATLSNSIIIVNSILQRRKLSQRDVKRHARGPTAINCQSWDRICFCCLSLSATPASSLWHSGGAPLLLS